MPSLSSTCETPRNKKCTHMYMPEQLWQHDLLFFLPVHTFPKQVPTQKFMTATGFSPPATTLLKDQTTSHHDTTITRDSKFRQDFLKYYSKLMLPNQSPIATPTLLRRERRAADCGETHVNILPWISHEMLQR